MSSTPREAPSILGGPQTESGSPLLNSPSFSATAWQMSFGERAVIEGVLAQLQPQLSIEIGTAEGGSLSRISAHSRKVISFDLVEPKSEVRALQNVELRTGDSHALLPLELERLASSDEKIDFILIDGDHSADGARRDMEDILASSAVKSTLILAHDTLNQEVRRGLEEVPYSKIDKVAFVDLDFVGGYVPAEPPLRGQCWGGLGLVVVDAGGSFADAHEDRRTSMIPLSDLVWRTAESMRPDHPENADSPSASTSELEHYRDLAQTMETSLSWRVTAPLRAASARLRQR